MTRKRRVGARICGSQGSNAAGDAPASCTGQRRGETERGAGIQCPNSVTPRHMEVGRGEGEIQRSRQARP